ncbi:hypothetical protein [Caulobacter phage DCM]|uniref:Uncharacterized protein n=1 Tax=Caulobacter phage DCM TaxID=3020391 RepID=A0AAF0B750_9CAUD|nr:hypothetical protein [Caulobacter phage DCM]WCD56095.1 hypothetical protein [Caulobacter phage BL199]
MSNSRTLLNKQGRKQGPVSRARWEIPASRATRMAGKAPSLVERAMAIVRGEGRSARIMKALGDQKANAQLQAHLYGGTPVV